MQNKPKADFCSQKCRINLNFQQLINSYFNRVNQLPCSYLSIEAISMHYLEKEEIPNYEN